MNEIDKPDQLSSTPTYTRRVFINLLPLGTAGVFVALEAACGMPEKEETFKKNEGEWSSSNIKKAALAMMKEEQSPTIVSAGKILFGNQQGQTVISSETPIFTDNLIRMRTVKEIISPYDGKPAPIQAWVSVEEPFVQTTLIARNGRSRKTIEGGSSLRIKEIWIAESAIQNHAEIVIKLLVAKEIYNIYALQLTTSYAAQSIFNDFLVPKTGLERQAVQVLTINRKTSDDVPVRGQADILTHFYLIPDYKKALDLGLITEKDAQIFKVMDAFARMFEKEGFLVKDPYGNYRWTISDESVLQMMFLDAARQGYKDLFQ